MIVFGWRLYRRFAETYDVPAADQPSRETVESAVEHVTDNVGKNGQRREHGDELLELVSQAAAAGYLDPDGEHDDVPYRVYQPQAAEGDAIALHLPSVYPEVRRFVRDYGLDSEYNLLSKTDYTDEFDDVAGDDSHVLAVSKYVRNVMHGDRRRCLEIDATRCRRRLGEDFIASAFGAQVELDDDEPDETGDDDGGGDADPDGAGETTDTPHDVTVTPLTDVADDPTGYADVQVEVAEISVPEPDNAPALTATVVDDSTAMDLVAWDDPTALDVAEGDTVLLENVATTEYDGQVQLVLKPSVTDQTPVVESLGGETPAAAADGGETAVETDTGAESDATNDDETDTSDDDTAGTDIDTDATDGRDDRPVSTRVTDWVMDKETGETFDAAAVADVCGTTPEKVSNVMTTLRHKGMVTELPPDADDGYEVV